MRINFPKGISQLFVIFTADPEVYINRKTYNVGYYYFPKGKTILKNNFLEIISLNNAIFYKQ